MSPGMKAIVYTKKDRAMLVLTKEDYQAKLGDVSLSIRLGELGLDSTVLMLDADSLQLNEFTSAGEKLVLDKLDVSIPRQLVLMNPPEKPSVIWRDLQTREVLSESWDTSAGQIQLRLRGVPGSQSKILVWIHEESLWVDVDYTVNSIQEIVVP